MGRCRVTSHRCRAKCTSSRNRSRFVSTCQRVPHRVYNDTRGIPFATVFRDMLTSGYSKSPLYSTTSLHSFLIVLFEKYAQLLEKQFSKRFDDVSQKLPLFTPDLMS